MDVENFDRYVVVPSKWSAVSVTPQRENEFHKLCNEAVQLGFERSWVDEMRQRVVARDPAWTMHKHELVSFLRGMIIWVWNYATYKMNFRVLMIFVDAQTKMFRLFVIWKF